MPTQVDPKYFNWGDRFQQGVENAQDRQKQNALFQWQQEDRSKAADAEMALKNALVSGDRNTVLQYNPDLAAKMDDNSLQWAKQQLPLLLANKDNPQAFSSLADRTAADPRARWYGLKREDITPEAVASLASQMNPQSQSSDMQGLEAFRQANPNATYEDYLRMKEQISYHPPADANKPPSGYQWGSGGLVPIPGGPAFPKPPSGYRPKADGSDGFEPIPGGPADLKIKQQKDKEFSAKRTVISNVDREIAQIDQLIGSEDGKRKQHPGLPAAIGVIDVRFPTVFQDTKDAEALLNSLKSKTSIDALRDIRSGGSGSVGQITEREWPRLEEMKVALDPGQGLPQFTAQLKEYREELKRTKREAMNVDISAVGSESPVQNNGPPQGVDPTLWAVMTPEEKAAWR